MAKMVFPKADSLNTRRPRIPVSEEDRLKARAGMDGEQTRAIAQPFPPVALAVPAPEPAVLPGKKATPEVPLAAESSAAVVSNLSPAASPPVTTAAKRPPRGRKPAAPEPTVTAGVGEEAAPVRSVKIYESIWSEIRLNLAQLPLEENIPTRIITYLEAAHRHYDAYLRKQGKLPPAK